MSCPTCDHTMQNIGAVGQRIFWCPRCGTLRTYTGEFTADEAPRWSRMMQESLYHHVYNEFVDVADKMLAESKKKAEQVVKDARLLLGGPK